MHTGANTLLKKSSASAIESTRGVRWNSFPIRNSSLAVWLPVLLRRHQYRPFGLPGVLSIARRRETEDT